jgi:hypothetical protein
MSSRHTPIRTLRIEDELWQAVQDRAAAEGLSVSEVIRLLLKGWLDSEQPKR